MSGSGVSGVHYDPLFKVDAVDGDMTSDGCEGCVEEGGESEPGGVDRDSCVDESCDDEEGGESELGGVEHDSCASDIDGEAKQGGDGHACQEAADATAGADDEELEDLSDVCSDRSD